MKNNFLIITLLFSFFCSCSSNPEQAANTQQAPKESGIIVKENFPKGQIIEQVVCKSDASQSYAMYLPKSYDMKKEFPVIYAFDAHGTGKLPVSNYQELAEQYGFIIIGSNNSQNGQAWEQSQQIASVLFADAESRLAINKKRVYVMGFSGGARIANGLTITNGAINGVICCGAANPAKNSVSPRNNYTFFGIAGDADFNYTEMKRYDMVELAGNKVKHAMISFDGKHEWPPVTAMEDAFLWLQVCAMREGTLAKDNALIAARLKTATAQLQQLLKDNKQYEAYELCKKTINYYEVLDPLTFFFETLKKLQTSPEVDKQMKANEALWNKEDKLKQAYVNALQTENYDWWLKDINALNQKIKTGRDKNEVVIQKRILSFLSLACYMQTVGQIKQNNIPAAEHYCKLYKLVDPTNTEADYLMAEIKVKQGDNAAALKALEQSVKNGFADKKRLEADSVFNALKNDAAFVTLKDRIK